MQIPFYQVDAFAGKVFCGNPAGVCLLDQWLPDKTLQSIAAENNLPETAFLLPADNHYEIRWFTPEVEVDLCGHATLASAHVVFEYIDKDANQVNFKSQSGPLSVHKKKGLLVLDFPSRPPEPHAKPAGLDTMLGAVSSDVLLSRDLVVVFENEETIRTMQPDLSALAKLEYFGIVVTAPGDDCDFVSRFFGPREGIPEDPVTGSAHCTLIPYWSNRLGKRELHARQLSKRGGELLCTHLGDRVHIGGKAVTYLQGTIEV